MGARKQSSDILLSLGAAGLLGKKRRPLSEIEADIEIVQKRLSALKLERKGLLASEKAKLQHQDPAYVAKLRAGRTRAHQDPERRAHWRDKFRETALANGWMLPPLSREQRLAYNRLLRKGVPRGEALQVARV